MTKNRCSKTRCVYRKACLLLKTEIECMLQNVKNKKLNICLFLISKIYFKIKTMYAFEKFYGKIHL